MALTQLWCSTSNPADGTAAGTAPGIATPTTAAGTTRIWRTSVASQANTGILFSAAGGTDAYRTTPFTGTMSVGRTAILTAPTSNVVTAITAYRTLAGVAFRLQWSAAGALQILQNDNSTLKVIAAAGVLTGGTRYIFQEWLTVATSTTGTYNAQVSNLTGTVLATVTSNAMNLGTAALTQFDLDTGGAANTYGWSELQYDDGRTSFIAPYAASSSFSGSSALTGTGALTAAGTPKPAGTAALTGTGTQTTTGQPAFHVVSALTGAGSLNTTGSPGYAGAASYAGTGALSTTGRPAVTGVMSLVSTGSLSVTSSPLFNGTTDHAGNGTLGSTATLLFAVTIALTGSGTLTSAHAQPARNITATASLGPTRWAAIIGNQRRAGTLGNTRRRGSV